MLPDGRGKLCTIWQYQLKFTKPLNSEFVLVLSQAFNRNVLKLMILYNLHGRMISILFTDMINDTNYCLFA